MNDISAKNTAAPEESPVIFLSSPSTSAFEATYLAVRQAEGRRYDDSVLRSLPGVRQNHPHYLEWAARAHSLEMLIDQLTASRMPLNILDLGCGNGWMARRLATLPGSQIQALDMNLEELTQGARVFADHPNLTFAYGDIFEQIFPAAAFDIIIAASVVQYFPEFIRLLKQLRYYLKPDGRIHILDSPFYTISERVAARRRSLEYYTNLGFPEMADHYYHHLWSDLYDAGGSFQYHPQRIINRISAHLSRQPRSPFPWVVITK